MDVLVVVHEQQPGHRAPEGGIHKGDPADRPDIVAQRAHAPRLIARAAQRGAERRGDEHRHERDRDHGDRQREVVERGRAVEADAEGRWARQTAQPVVAVGHRHPSIGRAPEDLGERERDHEKAEASRPQRNPPERAGDERRPEQRGGRGERVAQAELERHPRGEVRGEPEPGGVAERGQPAVADQEVQARREGRRDEDLAREVDVVLAGDPGEGGQGHREQRPSRPLHTVWRPKSPRGRNAMTTIIGRNRIT